ncbi:Copine-8 [Chamberlinius hualienensis]
MAELYPNIQSSGFRPGTVANTTTVVELRISCRNLKDRDITSKSDPMCVVFLKDGKGQYSEIFRTESVKNSVNPDFVKQCTIPYNFEVHQLLQFDIYDADCEDYKLSHHDYLGRMNCSLGEIVAAQGNQFKRQLSGKGDCGTIMVYAEEVGSNKKILRLQFSASDLDKKDFMGKSDPFLVFSKANEDGSLVVVHKTEVIKKNLNPIWRHFDLPLRTLCGGDIERKIKIQCFDWDSDGSHDLIGETETTARQLMKSDSSVVNTYALINPSKLTSKKSYKNSGMLRLQSCTEFEEYSFLDFLQGGTQLHFTVAVDFTSSNGNPLTPQSLHYINPGGHPNSYMLAIRSVGDIVADYDSDKLFPALGFGAKLPPSGSVSHEFFLNGNPANPYCQGVDGILEAYFNTLRVVQLYGPTNFAPVIRHVSRFAESSRDGSNYYVLLIITDGAISDMSDTKRAIINASLLPMSLIIVGVGNADFDSMEELDADRGDLSSGGQRADRDIVQFVPLQKFLSRSGNFEEVKAMLAKEVLAEIPNQVTSYMKKHAIKPKSNKA